MGYTHYFPQQRAFTTKEWNTIKELASKLFEKKKDILANSMGERDTKPVINDKVIAFNGIEDESHETFRVTKALDKNFNFCKTARKEYDIVAVAMLAIIDFVAPDALAISSDGKGELYMFEPGVKLAQEIAGIQFPSKLTETSWHRSH